MTLLDSVLVWKGSIQVVIVDSVPEGGPIGTVNGVAQMLSSGSRIISPTFASSLFSLSFQRNLLGGQLVYVVLIGLTLVGVYCTSILRAPATHTRSAA